MVAGVKQPVHWFLGGKGLGIQQVTSVWVGPPKSTTVYHLTEIKQLKLAIHMLKSIFLLHIEM